MGSSVLKMFSPRVKAGMRSVQGKYASPADGTLVRSVPLIANRCLQVKGIEYNAAELAGGQERDWAWATTVYLAPHNYHRVHAPFSGRLRQVRYIPGTLWPVNERFVSLVPQLFVKNERLVFEFELEHGAQAAVVMVVHLTWGA